MRGFVLFFLALMMGGALGIVADRRSPTKDYIDEVYGGLFGQPVPLMDENDVPIARTHFGATPFSDAALAPFGIRKCLNRVEPDAPDQLPVWLSPDERRPSLTDPDIPETFPDLAVHPGLIKIEIIQTPLGTERAHCGATRIAEHWFLTAAHCLESEDPNKAKPTYDVIAVTPATDVRGPDVTVVPVTGAVCHDNHGTSRFRYPNDIALFYLEDVTAFRDVPIATLESDSMRLTPDTLSELYYAAWGSNGGSRFLRGGAMEMREVGEAVLVGRGTEGVSPDVGDSGSPIYVRGQDGPIVVGLLSQVTPDPGPNAGRSAVYVRAKSARGWIERTMAMCEQNGTYVC